jgi:hypothetical protein
VPHHANHASRRHCQVEAKSGPFDGNTRVWLIDQRPVFAAESGTVIIGYFQLIGKFLSNLTMPVRRLIDAGKISATQVVPWAPWEISAEALESEEVLQAVRNAKRRLHGDSSVPGAVLPMFVEL